MTPADNSRAAAKLFGIFFILTFLSYGIGTSMVAALSDAPDYLSSIPANTTPFVTGAILMAIVHTFMNIGLPILILPILKPYGERLSYGYLSAAIVATTILAVGSILLLMLIPLSQGYLLSDQASIQQFDVLGMVLKSGGNIAYHMGMAIWSLGGMMFCTVLYRSKLLPRFMPIWGMFGYVTLAAGSISELFFHNNMVEIISVIPGGLFEVSLSLWLIFRGFSRPVNAH